MSTNINYKRKNYLTNNFLPNQIKPPPSSSKILYLKRENEMNELWEFFIKSYEYDEFYKLKHSRTNGLKFYKEPPSRSSAIKMLYEFLMKNKIEYSDNYNLTVSEYDLNREKSLYFLKNSKIWIMYIIIMSHSLKLNELLQIFKNALNYKVDATFLFEFFLILLSKYDTQKFKDNFELCMQSFPIEFINIFRENKIILNEIFGVGKTCGGINITNSINSVNSMNSSISNSLRYYNDEIIQEINDINDMNEIMMQDYSFECTDNLEFSFFHREAKQEEKKEVKMDIDIENEKKLQIVIEEDNVLMESLMKDDFIIEKSPDYKILTPVGLENSKSPCLDNYLLSNRDRESENKSNITDGECSKSPINKFNLEKALEKLNFKHEEERGEVQMAEIGGQKIADDVQIKVEEVQINEDLINEEESQINEEHFEEEDDENINYEYYNQNNRDKPEINVEQYYTDDNLLLIDKNFKNKNHFAIYILTNELKKFFYTDNKMKDTKACSLIYMITPLKKSFSDYPTEQIDVQIELNEIRASAYSNFIYFPYNIKLINLLEQPEEEDLDD